MITANATIEAAVECIKRGAYDFLCKPLDFDRLKIEVEKAIERNRLKTQIQAYHRTNLQTDFHGIVGRSEPMKQVYRLIETVAPTDAAILILGETGTGKELTARAIHECSARQAGPFVAVNAAAIPHELIESALFGHEKGSFTGAHQKHIGFCEQADGGTLFLDEICEMDYNVQAKLLRFLQDHTVQRVGAKQSHPVNVRVVAATNCDPNEQIQNRKLREDFYYRISMINIELPPLQQRGTDIDLLLRYFMDLSAAKYGKDLPTLTPTAMNLLRHYPWPGNIRQLENTIGRMVITAPGPEITPDHLPPEITSASPGTQATLLDQEKTTSTQVPSLQDMEYQLLLQALESTQGSVPQAAKILGISEATLYRKIKKHGITRSFG